MTDDRAKRLRELRNRTGGNRDDDDSSEESGSEADATDSSGSESTESDASDATQSTEPSESGSTEPKDTTANGPATPTDGASNDADRPADSRPSSTGESEPRTADAADSRTSDAASPSAPAGNDRSERAGPSGSERTGTPASGGGPGSATADEPTTVSYDETEAAAEPEGATASGIDPALQGAIADTSSMASAIETIGEEPTVDSSAVLEESGGHARSMLGRESTVFEQGNTLLHSTHDDENTVQMLEFYLNDSRYAIEIDRISAIVEMKDITRFPRGPEAIDGVTDLRGEITGVLDPTVMLSIERNELSDDQYIVVLKRDDDKQKLGVRVTDVSQAVTYRESQIDETGAVLDVTDERQHEFINGIIKKSTDDGTSLVTWLDIDAIIEQTNE